MDKTQDLRSRQIAAVHQSARPWMIGKAAMSLNGKMTRPSGQGQWLTGEAARLDVQHLRSRCDAILIGAETARKDNPKLTIRDIEVPRQPWRIVVTRTGNLPDHLHLFTDAHSRRTLVMSARHWGHLLEQLFDKGIRTVLVEGGGQVLNQLAEARLIDESVIYRTSFPLEGDDLVTAESFRSLKLRDPESVTFGTDIKVSGLVEKQPLV